MGVPVLTYQPQLGELSTSGGSSFAKVAPPGSGRPSHDGACWGEPGTPKGSGASSELLLRICRQSAQRVMLEFPKRRAGFKRLITFGSRRAGFVPSASAVAARGASSAAAVAAAAVTLLSIAEPLASEDQEECLSQSDPVLSVS